MNLKQMEVHTRTVGNNTFYIKPFPAFKASNICGQLATLITPIIGGLLPVLQGVDTSKRLMDMELSDMNFSDAAPAISGALSSLSGDKVEKLLKELLINNRNISYDNLETGKTVLLTEDAANEIFCGDAQDMLILAFEVIKINFNGFFKKLGAQFGSAFEKMTGQPSTENMASLT